ncbi:transcription initiation factor IIB [Methanobrevibacter sp.]|uniref:transcription initiation factor IIB n=1 Tax=Methanobrevibacter sp. TaxID=66852 RepID=UPI00386890DD
MFYPKEDDIITSNPYKISRKEEIRRRRERKQKNTQRVEEPTYCPECKSTDLVHDSQKAELSCRRCGHVIEEGIMDMGPEYRAFDNEQRLKRTRTGAPMSFAISDKGLSTVMGKSNSDVNGNRIPERNKDQYRRIRAINSRLRISCTGERNLAIALSELHRVCSKLGLPKVVREDAAIIYRSAAKNNLVRGRSIEGMVAAAVYTAARRCELPRTLDEVSDATNVSKKKISRNYRFLARELKIKLRAPSPADYVPRFASLLGASGEVESMAIDIVHKSKEQGLLNGPEPTGVAAATLYIASVLLGEKITQRQVAETANVSEVTIRNRYKDLTEKLNLSASL